MTSSLKLRHKVNGAILLTFALIAVIFSIIQLPFQQQRLQTVMGRVETILQTLVERDREHLANEIFESRMVEFGVEGRLQSVKIRLQQMREVQGILSIIVFDDAGKLLEYDGIQPTSTALTPTEREAAASGIQIRQERWQEHNTLSYFQEIQVIEERIGFIQIYYSLADVEREQRLAFLIFGSLLASILLVMLVVLNLMLSKTVVHPITYLRDAMQHVQTGKLGEQVRIRKRDEIGELSNAFNEMSTSLADEMANRKRAEEALAEEHNLLRTLIDNMPDFIYVKDTKSRLLLGNIAVIQSTGATTLEEIVGKTDFDLFPAKVAESFYTSEQTVLKSEQPLINQEELIEDVKTGRPMWLLTTEVPFRDNQGNIAGLVGISRDITELKRTQEELKKHRYRLEALIEERTEKLIETNEQLQREIAKHKQTEIDLKQAKEVAEAANRAKSVFLSNMSHELRTPLNSILGYSQILSRSRNLPPDEKEHLDTIMRSGEYLLALINDVLELSKIEANRVELQPMSFDLHQMLADLEAMFRLRAERKGLTLEFEYASDVPPYIRADQSKLRQVLINLLGNAVKYTEKGEITLRVAKGERRKAKGKAHAGEVLCPLPFALCLLFEISDTGIGIPPGDLESVFDAFVRVEDQQYNTGTGLGLPISRKYVRMMGGDIHAESDVGKGSTFSFELQVDLVAQSTLDTRPSTILKRVVGLEPGQPSYRLLIVEDNEDSRNLMVQVLKPMGFQVCEARNGAEAIALWNTWQPHLIWMDMRMPGMDGYAATRRIRAEGRQKAKGKRQRADPLRPSPFALRPVPIIALTASAFEEDHEKVLTAGCDDFVRKPFQENEIFEMLHKHLGVRFVYEESRMSNVERQRSKGKGVLTPEALAAVPSELVDTLEEAAKFCDLMTINEVLPEIRRHNAPLADALARLTDDFEYDKILALIQRGEGNTT